jgi:prepilin-type N-terminal cleavage/methylation domain-containing protein
MVKNNRGWTLTELLIVVAIIGGLAIIGPPITTQLTRFFILGRTKLELQQEARSAIYIITRELRQAQSNSIIIDRSGTQPYYSRIRFTKSQGTAVTVTQSGSSIIVTEGVNNSTLSKNLTYLSFTFPQSDDMTIVSVSLTLQKAIYGGATKALHMASERVRVMN